MKKPVKYLIVIAGPTAVGKSTLAVEIADWLSTEILSADSRQIYREMNIGTAKPPPGDLLNIRHHFINERSVSERFSAADFEQQGLERLAEIHKKKDVAVLCGGTGLYINALTTGLDKIPDVDVEVRRYFDLRFEKEGIEVLQRQLLEQDPDYAGMVDLANHRRLIRALSVIETTGKPFSSFLKTEPGERPFKMIPILLVDDRQLLYARIDQRVDQMVNSGLEEEVRALRPFRETQALQTVGYQEWFPYFDGEIDLPEVLRLIKRNSRRYAKRQMTWFRKYGTWVSFLPGDRMSIKAFIENRLGNH
ncbi:MAG: tRNA (adenosine(37)-N6)-dimethylallyltransferase MiaA [Saprospiraceae bacterium]|nr:tRNA (adenosine(37)-N6)-dimethylallyltransferase MiaA [Saprospiraceae bacterium]